MGIEFKFFKAGQGDSILVSTYKEINEKREYKTHILIDGGANNLYTRELNKLKKTVSKLDLVILTHLDNDHIIGLRDLLDYDIKNIQKKNTYSPLIKEVWFNAFKDSSNIGDAKFKNPIKQIKANIKNQIKFRELMSYANDKIKYQDYISIDLIKKPITVNDDVKLFLLSPNDDKLRNLYFEYEEELRKTKISDFDTAKDKNKTIENLSLEPFNKNDDTSVANGSSIAFILCYGNKKFLFLADAHIHLITESLKNIKNKYFPKENKLKFEFIKLSHHGSRNNIESKFLNLVETNNYVILTNSKGKNRHPDKETLSKILVHNKNCNYPNKIRFIFNYALGAKDYRYDFKEEDKIKYNFELLHMNNYPWDR